MTHFVYVLGTGSRWADNELRYSLRSLSNVAGEHEVWVVGYHPPWLKNVRHISCTDIGSNPIVNVCRKMLFALDLLPEEFTWMNDDFYIVRPVDSIPLLHNGAMRDRLKSLTSRNTYANAFRETYDILRLLQVEQPVRYDIHLPFPMSKAGLKELPVAWPSGRFSLKNLYGNLIHEGRGAPGHDVKAGMPLPQWSFWSSPTVLHRNAKQFLIRKLPMRSYYE